MTFTSLQSVTWLVGLEKNHSFSNILVIGGLVVVTSTIGFTGRWSGVASQLQNSGVVNDATVLELAFDLTHWC